MCLQVEGRLCIYMEYVHPGSVNTLVQERVGGITEFEVRQFTHHMLSGLAYLHSNKTVHRCAHASYATWEELRAN